MARRLNRGGFGSLSRTQGFSPALSAGYCAFCACLASSASLRLLLHLPFLLRLDATGNGLLLWMANGACAGFLSTPRAQILLHEQNGWLLVALPRDALAPWVLPDVAAHRSDDLPPDLEVVVEIVTRVLVRHSLPLPGSAPLADFISVVEAYSEHLGNGRVDVA